MSLLNSLLTIIMFGRKGHGIALFHAVSTAIIEYMNNLMQAAVRSAPRILLQILFTKDACSRASCGGPYKLIIIYVYVIFLQNQQGPIYA